MTLRTAVYRTRQFLKQLFDLRSPPWFWPRDALIGVLVGCPN
jgi:hypothetical protein